MQTISATSGFTPLFGARAGGPGRMFSGARLAAGTDADEAFAGEAVRRATQEGSQAATGAARAGSREGSSSRLESALAEAMDYVRTELGEEAATTVKAITLRHLNTGEAGENALGSALSASLEFVDRAFGTAAGDKLIGHFNGELNDAINEHFQNGAAERFLVAGGTGADVGGTVSLFVSGLSERFGAKAAGEAKSLIEQALADGGESYVSARKGFGAALDHLEKNYGADASEARDMLDAAFAAFLGQGGYGQGGLAGAAPTTPRGQALDLSV